MLHLAMALSLLTTTAWAEDWTCSLTRFCRMDAPCESIMPERPATFTVFDSKSAGLMVAAGTEDEDGLLLILINEGWRSRSYVSGLHISRTSFLTIYTGGELIVTAHEKDGTDIRTTSIEGTCTRKYN